MTGGCDQVSGNVLTLFLTRRFTRAISLRRSASERGALARRRSVGAGTVPWQGSHPRRRVALGSPVLAQVRRNKPCARRRPALPFHPSHRAGLPLAPPSINLRLRAPKLWAYRCWLFDRRRSSSRRRHHIHHVMAGPVPAIPIRRAALQSIGITGTRPVMTSEGTGAEGPRAERRTPIRDRENRSPAPSSRRRPGSITATALQPAPKAVRASRLRGTDNVEGRAPRLPAIPDLRSRPIRDDDGESRRGQHCPSA
jgi:hypothetical protein